MEIATLQDLQQMKAELIEEIRSLLKGKSETPPKWVKSKEAREILGCSPGTLQNLRQNRTLEFSRVGGSLYYNLESIMNLLEKNRQNAGGD